MRRIRGFQFIFVLTILLGLTTTLASAATFSDIEGHWSESYVEDVYSQGLVNGYDDGTFGPDQSVTYCQALLFTSRLADLSQDIQDEIVEKWQDDVLALLPDSVSSWAYEEICLCIQLGILSLDELETLCDQDLLTAAISRQTLTLYLTRAVQLDGLADSYSSYSLSFGDTSSIDASYLPYVYLLNSLSIIQGDNEGNFNPTNSLSRGEVATLLSRTLDLIEEVNILFELADYNDYSDWVGGVITTAPSTASSGVTTLTLLSDISGSLTLSLPLGTTIYEYNMETTTDALSTGDYVRVNYDTDGDIVSAVIGGSTETSLGTIVALSADSVTIWNSGGYESYTIDSFTLVSAGNLIGDASVIDLSTDYTSAQCTVNQLGQLTSLSLYGGSQTVYGLFSSYSTSQIALVQADGTTVSYPLASGAALSVDGITYSYLYSSLAGSYIALEISYDSGEIITAQLDTSTTCIQGYIRSYDDDDDPRYIYVTDITSGDYTKYDISDDAIFYYNGAEIDMSDLEKSWFVTLLLEDDEAVLLWCYDESSQISGTLSSITYGVTTYLELTLADGGTASFTLDVTDLPTFYRDGVASSIDKLTLGDDVALDLEYSQIDTVYSYSQSANYSGTIDSITKTSTGTTLAVTLTLGYTEYYTLSTSATIQWDGDDLSSGDLEIGSEISMLVLDREITSIEVISVPTTSTSSSGVYTAEILSTDSSAGTFFVIIDGAPVTAYVSGGKFSSSSTGLSLYFKNFDPGNYIQIYGSYSDGILYSTLVVLIS